ncbi:MAG: hypothetical protein H6719_11005 [Sandaracinaceae bacterium]|nr:hypothetical protein [Sandaracinaceae bacterium]
MRALLVVGLVLLSLGCEDRVIPPPPGGDAGPRLPMDAGVPTRRDGGSSAPVVDGTLDDAEWAGATAARSNTPTDTDGSVLTRLVARVVDDALYVGVEGTLADGDTLVLYVDHTLGGADGVDDLASLTDEDGALDADLSSPVVTPTDFRADFAWGTTSMPRTSVGLDAETGWRNLGTPDRFTWVAAETAPTVCSDTACETSIPLAELGGARPRTLAMFARIAHTAGGWANQTLPGDDASAPGVVNVLYEIDDGSTVTDGGVADGGLDGSTPTGIVLDGVIDPADEWAAATLFEQSTTGTGAFAGDQAQALYVLRDSVSLRVALRGTLGADHAFVMYVDNDVSGVDGLASPTPLDDFVGALDTALSKSMVLPSELRIDAAWGTLDMDRTAAVGDDRMGWRSLFDPSTFTNLPGATVCGTEVCETEIALADLGVAATAEIGLYVRLVSANTAAFSNQTLPLDDGFSPEVVSVYVSIPPP